RSSLECLDDPRMSERQGDLAFARLFERLEAGLECLRLLWIKDLQADRLARLAVAGHVKAGHGAADRFAQQLEPLGDVDSPILEHVPQVLQKAKSHSAAALFPT